MRIVGKYSLKEGERIISEQYGHLLKEIEDVLKNVNAEEHKTKKSKEKTMKNTLLYSPTSLNKDFEKHFFSKGWVSKKISCEYKPDFYVQDYKHSKPQSSPFREMDFVKEKLGVEIQFGKYAFMVYNVCAKMTIFKNKGIIDCGIEIVPIKEFADSMSTGVSYFEQFVWDLQNRGEADIDIPVLILGIKD